MKATKSLDLFQQILQPHVVESLAREVAFGRRRRALTPARIFWAMILFFGSEPRRTLTGITRFVGAISRVHVSRQALHQRLDSAPAVAFMQRCFEHLLERSSRMAFEVLPAGLASFRDLCLIDSTTLKLAERLDRYFPACRVNVRKAALKIHACMSLATRDLQRIRITGERVSDSKRTHVGRWIRDRLLLFDLGYFDYGLFRQITRFGEHFVSRLKKYANGTIVAVRGGCTRRMVGKQLNGHSFTGEVVDLDVSFGRGRDRATWRVVGLWNEEGSVYHWYVTSLDAERFGAALIGQIYRLRWQIELLFKEWKSICRLKDLTTGKRGIMLCLVYASLCTALLTRMMLRKACQECRQNWHDMSTWQAMLVLTHFTRELGECILEGKKKRLLELWSRISTAIGIHAERSCAHITKSPCFQGASP